MGLGVSLLLFIEWFWNMNMNMMSIIMIRTPLLMSFFVFLQLLAILAHARTLSVPESSWNMFTQSTNLKMPTSLQPPSPAEKEKTGAFTCAPESSSCSKFTQYQKSSAPPPPAPKSPYGPVPSARPSSPAECLCGWLTSIPRSTSPCLAKRLCIRFKTNYYGKSSSSSIPTSPASSSLARHVKRKDSYPCSAENLCNKVWNMMDKKKPSLSPPPPPMPHTPVASSPKSPPSLNLATSWFDSILQCIENCISCGKSR